MKTIEQLLVDDAGTQLPDDGFSQRVMGALPRTAQHVEVSKRCSPAPPPSGCWR